jgi:hypothetical protein
MDERGFVPTLTDCDDVTLFDEKSGTTVRGDISVALFKTIIFLPIMEIIATNNNCSLHFCGDDNTAKNSTTNGYVAGEWTLLVDVVALNRSAWCFETQTNVFPESQSSAINLIESRTTITTITRTTTIQTHNSKQQLKSITL